MIRLSDLLDIAVVRSLAEANYQASGMPIGLVDATDGGVLVAVGWQDICTLYHRANALSLERCRESDRYVQDHLAETEPCEYRCKNGLRDIGIPVRVAGQHLATLFLGQFFYEGEEPDRSFFEEQARRLHVDAAGYLGALDRVPVFSRERVDDILRYDLALARFIAGIGEGALRRWQAEARAADLARFPEENPDPVLRLSRDATVAYANESARAAFGPLGLRPGARAPEALAALADAAQSSGERVEREVVAGDLVYSVTAKAVGGDVNAYGHDVTARVRAERALASASKAKDEFLAMLSHELRNPLAPIRNSLYVLEHADVSGEPARRARGIAGRQVAHLTRLVDDLLDMTRIVQGPVELRRGRVELGALARRSGEDQRAQMRERELEFTVDSPADEVWVEGDETRLAQIIGNLLHNAAKFTSQGGRVNLSVRAADAFAEIEVRDTGRGIEPELLDRLFDPFVQGSQSLARTEGGLGLGLALVKRFVEAHGGSVSAVSAGRDRGAAFLVRLPLLRAPPPADRATERPVTPRLRVLVVDDNRDAAESLADLVRVFGHEAELAFDGESAIRAISTRPPDVVLCDIGLPGVSGYQVARTLRSDPRLDGIRLIAVSGYAQPEDRERALAAGFIEHLPKPADPARVLRLLSDESPRRSA